MIMIMDSDKLVPLLLYMRKTCKNYVFNENIVNNMCMGDIKETLLEISVIMHDFINKIDMVYTFNDSSDFSDSE